ncbi:MAG TPA: sugar transferase [Baekduia sp.]|nr:sugar transferase [Baekduia sp.]
MRRAFDIAFSATLLVLTSPLLAIAAIAITVESRGGGFYRQRRVGRGGQEFDVLKLRTMVDGAEHQGAGLAVDAGDARITKVGAILRRTSIDELPNLVNVLRGEMAVIGPRPTVPSQVERYTEHQLGRLAIKPGITGWAQVNGRASLPWAERIELDLWYIEHRSLKLDLQILGRTALLVVGGDGLYRGATGGWDPEAGGDDQDAERAAAARTFRRRRIVAGVVLVAVLAAVALGVRAVVSGGSDEPTQPVVAFEFQRFDVPQWLVKDAAVARAQRRLDFVARGGAKRKEIALTFDDGPTPYTPQILKVLTRYSAHATFFQVGKQVREHPEITARMAKMRGIEIGNHTDAHARLDRISEGEQEQEIAGGAQAIISAGGAAPRLFRPPYGATNSDTLKILDRLHELSGMWAIDSADYTRPGVKAIVDEVVSKAQPGSVVLMHDGVENRAQTVAAIPKIIQRLRKRGYQFVTVSEMLFDNPPPELSEDAVPNVEKRG